MSASFCSSSSTAGGGALSRLNTVNASPPAVSRAQAHAGDVHFVLCQQRAEIADDARLVLVVQQQQVPVTGISTDWLNSRTMRGLFGEPKKVPPAEINFLPLLKTWTCTHSLNVTGSSDFFSSTVMPMLCGDAADVDVVHVLQIAAWTKSRAESRASPGQCSATAAHCRRK